MASSSKSRFFIGSLAIFFVLFLLVYLILSSSLSLGENTTPKQLAAQADALESTPQPSAPNQLLNQATKPGEKIARSICAKCHRFGLMRAPKLGNERDWRPRLKKGMDTLYSHAIEGFNKMPPKGDKSELTDQEVKQAVDYMVSLVGTP